MKYIEFRIGNKNLAIERTNDLQIEPTLINKVGPVPINTPHSKLIDGLINYKGRMIPVLDISSLYEQESLKKFDGLLFIENKNEIISIKYEGFYKDTDEYSGTLINVPEIFKKIKEF